MHNEFKRLNCSYWYRDLITWANKERCDFILETVILDVFNYYNRYDLLQGIPNITAAEPREKLSRFLEAEQTTTQAQFNRAHFLRNQLLKQGDPWDTPFVTEYLNRADVKEALHIPAKVT